MAKQQSAKRGPKCHFCYKFGHIQRNCIEHAHAEKKPDSSPKEKNNVRQKVNKAEMKERDSSSSGSEVGLVVCHALAASNANQCNSWIVDSGATCHMYNSDKQFV